MKKISGYYIQDDDVGISAILQRDKKYQSDIRRAAIEYCKTRILAIDAGAHVGLWSRDFCKEFQNVVLFEPNSDNYECLQANIAAYQNWRLVQYGLGDKSSICFLKNKGNKHLGGTKISIDPTDHTCELITLDSFPLQSKIDLIKFDIEGYEFFAIQGAINTILKDKPIIVIEQKQTTSEYGIDRYAAKKLLLDIGAKILKTVNDDIIFGW